MRKLLFLLVFSVLTTVSSAYAVTISKYDGTANGEYADGWWFAEVNPSGSGEELLLVNNHDPIYAEDFFMVGKSDGSTFPGWTFTVTSGLFTNGDDVQYGFYYTLNNPDLAGEMVDFALAVKQASNYFSIYYFEDVVLNIDGYFNSMWLNPQGKLTGSISHVSAFVTEAAPAPAPAPVPEPATLLLLGVGLVGLGAYRRAQI